MHEPFEVTREQARPPCQDVVILRIKGYLDAHTTPSFEQMLEKVREDGALRIVIDCEHLDYISSSGLGVLVDAYRALDPQGGAVKIAAMSPAIADILDILGFSKIIGAYASVADALASFADAPEEAPS